MRFDLCLRLARERGRSARCGAVRFPIRRALAHGIVAAACVAGTQGAFAMALADAGRLPPAATQAADLVDVPFFNSARTIWGGLLAPSATPGVALDARMARVHADAYPGMFVVRAGACAPYVVLCDAARAAIERGYAGRFAYGFASPLPVAGTRSVFEPRRADLSAAEPFMLAEPQSGTRAGAIRGSLRGSLARDGLPAGVAAQVLRLLAGRLDVSQRGVAGDTFRVAFEPDADALRPGRPRVTALDIRFRDQRVAAVWFSAHAGAPGAYYGLDGAPFAGTRFAMPVSATRTSSHFGTRVHPVSGVRHVHSGVDLAAPAGRAVHASERGVVSFIGTEPGGYGKYVVVRHDRGYASYYAHLSAFEPSLRTGMRIARGQRLGAVGSTGTATGPHLHFEMRRNNRPVDPVALVQAANAAVLKGQQRVAFDRVARAATTRLAAAEWSQPVAMSKVTAPQAG
ncbi:M23 family metallopeptidase [Burkholderia latens]|uniref:M23 family metallopeptidase n=1 Tax=Burkholderia latens TaxID=488446 RepID=A0A6H9SNF1_9BURK|nr:M23 family metallopeptidase [Burkholderia latens]KAB0640494.1 M23 family metallopeptidase [Burkholderia latens]VWB30162.1 peptidase M23 [Burkholderia latens]